MHQVIPLFTYTIQYEYELPGWDEFMHTEWDIISIMATSSTEAAKLLKHIVDDRHRLLLNYHILKTERVQSCVYNSEERDIEERSHYENERVGLQEQKDSNSLDDRG